MSDTGPTNATYYVVTSTDLNLPLNLWTPVATNTFNGSGQFSITIAVNPNQPQTFYRLQLR